MLTHDNDDQRKRVWFITEYKPAYRREAQTERTWESYYWIRWAEYVNNRKETNEEYSIIRVYLWRDRCTHERSEWLQQLWNPPPQNETVPSGTLSATPWDRDNLPSATITVAFKTSPILSSECVTNHTPYIAYKSPTELKKIRFTKNVLH
jgi:hypothetical protein